MNEHRFKLKKDGKTVGYMQISEEVDTLSTTDPMAVFIKKVNGEWRTYEFDSIRHYKVTFNSVHPFVTKDKNGKDVFAGDSVRSGKRVLTIVWDKCDMQWKTKQPRRTPAAEYYLPNTPLCQWAISEQFELIEEKEDE